MQSTHDHDILIVSSPAWRDYELLDSGNGQKLERFGPHVLIRPEAEAIWKPALADQEWHRAAAVFQPAPEENGGHWQFRKSLPEEWKLTYASLSCLVRLSSSRHVGIFPEQASQWDFIREASLSRPDTRVLNLFGYTGLATLAAAAGGAQVTHVDASRKAITWARQNQALSGLESRPIRWIVDDALKFVQREARRGAQYDGIILDPPKFGRGPKGGSLGILRPTSNIVGRLPPGPLPQASFHPAHRLCGKSLLPHPGNRAHLPDAGFHRCHPNGGIGIKGNQRRTGDLHSGFCALE